MHAEYKLNNGKWCCHPYSTQCPVLREKNSKSLKPLYSKNKDGITIFNGKQRNYSEDARKRQGWNRGLTKETSDLIRERGERLHERFAKGELVGLFTNHTHTVESKNKIVQGMLHTSGSSDKGFKRGWYKGYRVDSSWELAFVMYNIDHSIPFERNIDGFEYVYEGKTRLFYPDFKMSRRIH